VSLLNCCSWQSWLPTPEDNDMDSDTIIARIRAFYPDAAISINGADCNFELQVITSAFAGVSLVKRQQSILGLFRDELAGGQLHALSVKARTPDEQKPSSGLVQLS
jgi:acid stress-induced BolA-like protein IbaG/YrbA